MNAVRHSTQRSIGAILVDTGRLNAEDAERILRFQKGKNLRFGDAAIELGILTEGDIRYALSYQFDYAYLVVDRGQACQRRTRGALLRAIQSRGGATESRSQPVDAALLRQ